PDLSDRYVTRRSLNWTCYTQVEILDSETLAGAVYCLSAHQFCRPAYTTDWEAEEPAAGFYRLS
ncbi:hypothetical protein Ancab_019218, partial [Ancistrocladus abbreviatus]